jgi:hypothetical protein
MSVQKQQLQKVGAINDVPEEMLPNVLEKGQIAVYQLVTGVANPLPIGDQHRKKEVFYGARVTIPPRDRIKVGGRLVEIGVPMEFDDKTVTRYEKFGFAADQNHGIFAVTAGDSRMERFYPYFELSNYNESNPNRDTNITPLFKRLDPKAEAKEKLRKGTALGLATSSVTNMTAAEVRKIAAALNMDTMEEAETLRGELMERAVTNPEAFVALLDDPATRMKSVIKRATDLGVIGYDPSQKKYMWGDGNTIAKLDLEEGKTYIDSMGDWLKSHPSGPEVAKKIEKLVAAELKRRSVDPEAGSD